MKQPLQYSRSGFTLVELIVGMTVFAIGLTGIYALLSGTIGNSMYSRHEVVVANLLREQIELVKNIRDTNIRNFLPWDALFSEGMVTSKFHSGVYIVENDFSHDTITIRNLNGEIQNSPVYVKDVTLPFSLANDLDQKFQQSVLYIDAEGRYTHTPSQEKSPYASYTLIYPIEIQVSPGNTIEVKKDNKYQGYIIDARVIVHTRGVYREYDAKSAITDWIR